MPRRPCRRPVLCLALAVCASSPVLLAQREMTALRRPPGLEDILLRAGRFVRDTQARLNGVVADESYQQTVSNPMAGASNGYHRSIRSEVLFLVLPEARDLVFVRTVLAVDGERVPDSTERLNRLFSDPPRDPYAYIRQLKQESARFNIGSTLRTTGDPAFALRFLDPEYQDRFAYTRVGIERVGAVQAVKVAFSEQEFPTLITFNGTDVLASGTLWLDPADGAVVRTNMKVNSPDGNASITVDFRRDAHLQQWVPSRMTELYGSGTVQETKCSASYTNFRRFDTSVRVSTP